MLLWLLLPLAIALKPDGCNDGLAAAYLPPLYPHDSSVSLVSIDGNGRVELEDVSGNGRNMLCRMEVSKVDEEILHTKVESGAGANLQETHLRFSNDNRVDQADGGLDTYRFCYVPSSELASLTLESFTVSMTVTATEILRANQGDRILYLGAADANLDAGMVRNQGLVIVAEPVSEESWTLEVRVRTTESAPDWGEVSCPADPSIRCAWPVRLDKHATGPTSPELSFNVPYRIAVTAGRNELKVFVNGVHVASRAYGGELDLASEYPLTLGVQQPCNGGDGLGNPCRGFAGFLSAVYVYATELSEERAKLMSGEAPHCYHDALDAEVQSTTSSAAGVSQTTPLATTSSTVPTDDAASATVGSARDSDTGPTNSSTGLGDAALIVIVALAVLVVVLAMTVMYCGVRRSRSGASPGGLTPEPQAQATPAVGTGQRSRRHSQHRRSAGRQQGNVYSQLSLDESLATRYDTPSPYGLLAPPTSASAYGETSLYGSAPTSSDTMLAR